jgi:hypothetical protein
LDIAILSSEVFDRAANAARTLLAQKRALFIKRARTGNNGRFVWRCRAPADPQAPLRTQGVRAAVIHARRRDKGGLNAKLCVNAQQAIDLLTNTYRRSEQALR